MAWIFLPIRNRKKEEEGKGRERKRREGKRGEEEGRENIAGGSPINGSWRMGFICD